MSTEKPKFTLGQMITNSVFSALFFPALLLLLGGNWSWKSGWLFGLWLDAMILSVTIYLYVKDPALLAERAQAPGSKNQKPWDRYLLTAIYLIAIAWLLIMPLDAERFRWSPVFPLWLKALGTVILIPALYLIVMPTVENTYLSTLVRIQTDRKQHVITTGVYSFVRHPLYLGCLLMMVGGPLLLGSIWGLVITLIGVILVVGRIIGEESMLTDELEGYEEYKSKVVYRLIPFIW